MASPYVVNRRPLSLFKNESRGECFWMSDSVGEGFREHEIRYGIWWEAKGIGIFFTGFPFY